LKAVSVAEVKVLSGPGGAPVRDQGFNPEGAALTAEGNIAIVSEAGPKLSVFSREGIWLRDEPLPDGVRNAALQKSTKDGLESLGWSERTGFITAVEEPQQGEPRDRHTLYSSRAGSLQFSTQGMDNTSIKAIETAEGSAYILERTVAKTTGAKRQWLRRLSVDGCFRSPDCGESRIPLPETGFPDADFEGLAAS
jgi:Esterase-like activity of phytase